MQELMPPFGGEHRKSDMPTYVSMMDNERNVFRTQIRGRRALKRHVSIFQT